MELRMQRLGQAALRVFKSLAGLEKDEPLGSYAIALYGLLFLIAMSIVVAWATGTPPECAFGNVCE